MPRNTTNEFPKDDLQIELKRVLKDNDKPENMTKTRKMYRHSVSKSHGYSPISMKLTILITVITEKDSKIFCISL